MKSLLRRDTVRIESLGRDLEIQELSAKAVSEINEAYRQDNFRGAVMVCKLGVPEWAAEDIDDMMPAIPMRVIEEILQKVYALSGINVEGTPAKNSESVPSVDSSSVLPH